MSISSEATITLSLIAKDLASGNIQKVATSLDNIGKKGSLAGAALKGAGLVAGAGFAVITAGALQAEGAQGRFMSATGKSREEAKLFVSGMDSLAGSAGAVGKSFEDIAAAGTMVEQQFGTTGQKTIDLTNQILEFSKVTGQDAVGAASDLEDTLSSFGLGAEDAAGLMDKLKYSSQTFGTDAGPAATQALRDMAPALDAMGMKLDDGIAFLNAFEVAGGNASDAASALDKAIKTLKPGQDINDLITQVGAIKDPLLHAQKATELFGKAAGPGMAQLIKPGMTSLDDFGVSAEDAAGSVHKAADDMLTLGDRIRGWGDKALAGARELGQQFGPALSGVSAIASTLGPTLISGFQKAWAAVKDSPAVQGAAESALDIAGTATGAAGTIIGNLSGNLIQAVTTSWDKVKAYLLQPGSATQRVIAAAGAASGAVYGAAAGVAEALAGALTSVWVAVGSPGSAVIAAARGAGLASGAAWLTAAIAALGPLGLAVIGKELADKLAGEGKPGGANFADNWLAGARARAAQQTPPAAATIGGNLGYALSVTGIEAGTKMAAATVGGFTAGGAWGHMGDFVTDQMTSAAEEAGTAGGETAVSSWQTAMSEAAKRNKNSMTLWDIELIKEKARNDAAAAAHEFALGWQDGVPSIHQQWKDFVKSMDHALDPTTEMAWLHGKLTSKRLADGLASNDPIIRARAQNEQSILQKEWDGLYALGYRYGEDAGQGVAAGVRDTSSKASAAAAALARQVNAALSKIVSGIQVHVGINGDQWAHGVRIPTFAKGGHIPANQLSIIGEEGPELWKPDTAGTVIPRGSSGAALGLSGAQINLSFPSLIPYSGAQMAQAARDFIPELVREMRRQRLLPQGGF